MTDGSTYGESAGSLLVSRQGLLTATLPASGRLTENWLIICWLVDMFIAKCVKTVCSFLNVSLEDREAILWCFEVRSHTRLSQESESGSFWPKKRLTLKARHELQLRWVNTVRVKFLPVHVSQSTTAEARQGQIKTALGRRHAKPG